MNTNNLINNMLELCEQHMNEGDYVESAKLLKTLYENQDYTEHTFENPIIFSNDDKYELFRVLSFKKFKETHNKYTIKNRTGNIFELCCCRQFTKYVECVLNINSVCDLHIENSIMGDRYWIDGEDYIKLHRKIHNIVDDEDDKDFEFMESMLLRKLTESITELTRLTIDKVLNNEPFH